MKIDLATRKRFAANIRKDPATGCWLWGGNLWNGYGAFSVNGRNYRVHRLMWELVSGPIPKGLEIHHKCNTRNCVNPRHLEILSRREHAQADAKHGAFRGENNGNHKLTETEVYFARILHDLGETVDEIAERFSVSRRMIHYILSERYWQHLRFPENLPPVNIKETLLRLYEPLEEIYKLRVERSQPLPEGFADLCRVSAAILMAEERANG
jgi:hypothetical protein